MNLVRRLVHASECKDEDGGHLTLLREYAAALEVYHSQLADDPLEEAGRLAELIETLDVEVLELEETDFVSAEQWKRLLGGLEELQQDLEVLGGTKWRDFGPTGSVRLNQLLFLCQEPPDPIVVEHRLEACREVRHLLHHLVRGGEIGQDRGRQTAVALERIEEESAAQLFDIGEAREQLLQSLVAMEAEIDLRKFDAETEPDIPWWETFVCAVEENVEKHVLLSERDRFAESLRTLKTSEKGDDKIDAFVDSIDELLEHLETLKPALQGTIELESWCERLLRLGDCAVDRRRTL